MLPGWGLCENFKHDELFKLIDPERGRLDSYWAYAEDFYSFDKFHDVLKVLKVRRQFTPLRQNIVLLMAAMAGQIKNL